MVIGNLQLVIGNRQLAINLVIGRWHWKKRQLVIGQTKVTVLFLDRVEFLDRLECLDRPEYLDRMEFLVSLEYLDRL